MLAKLFPSRVSRVPLLTVLVLVACGEDGPTDPAQGLDAVVSIEITLETATLVSLGETLSLSAEAQDAEDRTVSGVSFTWSSSDEGVASVNSSGDVRAVGNGQATITASHGETAGSASIVVSQRPDGLTFTNRPHCGIPAGAVITPPVRIAIQDAGGSVVSEATEPVSLTIQSNPGGGTLGGPTTATPAAGVAIFDALTIDEPGAGYTLMAVFDTLSAPSSRFDIERGPRALCVEDPPADHTGTIDVVKMVMNFDTLTGDYEILLTASSANPFMGDFRININLFNVDFGTTALFPGFFSDAVNDFSGFGPAATVKLTGSDARLQEWARGQRVHTNSLAGTPNPDGVSLYRSGVLDLPLTAAEDVIAYADLARPAIIR